MDRAGGARPAKRWRLLFLSSGEVGLSEHLAAVQNRAKAGQRVRMVEIPADGGRGRGVFEELHGRSDGAALALALADAAATNYGAAFVACVETLIRDAPELPPYPPLARTVSFPRPSRAGGAVRASSAGLRPLRLGGGGRRVGDRRGPYRLDEGAARRRRPCDVFAIGSRPTAGPDLRASGT